VTLTLTSDDLESHIVINVSSTLTNTTIWFMAALSLNVDICMYVRTDVRMYVRTDGCTYGQMDTFTRFIRSSLRRWPKKTVCQNNQHTYTHNHFTALWILSGTTRVSRYQKKHSPT